MIQIADRFQGWTLDYIGDLTILQFAEIHRYMEQRPLPLVRALFQG